MPRWRWCGVLLCVVFLTPALSLAAVFSVSKEIVRLPDCGLVTGPVCCLDTAAPNLGALCCGDGATCQPVGTSGGTEEILYLADCSGVTSSLCCVDTTAPDAGALCCGNGATCERVGPSAPVPAEIVYLAECSSVTGNQCCVDTTAPDEGVMCCGNGASCAPIGSPEVPPAEIVYLAACDGVTGNQCCVDTTAPDAGALCCGNGVSCARVGPTAPAPDEIVYLADCSSITGNQCCVDTAALDAGVMCCGNGGSCAPVGSPELPPADIVYLADCSSVTGNQCCVDTAAPDAGAMCCGNGLSCQPVAEPGASDEILYLAECSSVTGNQCCVDTEGDSVGVFCCGDGVACTPPFPTEFTTPSWGATMAVSPNYDSADLIPARFRSSTDTDLRCDVGAVAGIPGIRCYDSDGAPLTFDSPIYTGQTFDITIDNGASTQVGCLSISDSGVQTYSVNEQCRPSMAATFTAAALQVDGTHCVLSDVALSGYPAQPTVSCADNDSGRMVLLIPRTPPTWDAGTIDVTLTAHSISNQSGLTIVRDMAVVCTASGEQLATAPATADLNRATITFPNLANAVAHSNTVSIATSGCTAGEQVRLLIDNDDAGTATQSSTTAMGVGGVALFYKGTSR